MFRDWERFVRGPRHGRYRGGPGGPFKGRMFEQGDLKYVILKLLAEKPRHGYEVIRTLEERMGGAYAPSPGAVYPTLTMLEEMGYEVCAIEASEIDAVAGALRCDPDLLIVDAQLSDGSGVSAVAQILRTGFIPHVFMSGDVAGVTALRPDAVVVQKPFTQSSFCAQSFSLLQGFFEVQLPATQCWPPGHSLSPAQARQRFAMHSCLAGHCALLLQ